MKNNIHPKYYDKSEIRCACGKQWVIGSTLEKINIAICGNCHPFYTGQEKIVDTRGQVEKFKKRMEKSRDKARTS